jgi:hypothetical protein
LQRGQHNIEDELVFANHPGYVFHDSRGFEAGGEDELKTAQSFVARRSQRNRLKHRLHAIWFVTFDIHVFKFTGFTSQVLYSDE